MALTKTEIVNMAITLLGGRTLTDADTDTTTEADLARVYYKSCIESLLSETVWDFATKRVILTVNANPIPYSRQAENFIVSYDVPSDVVQIFDTSYKAAIWRREGVNIISDTIGLGIRYTYLNNDPSTYPTYFSEALADYLAYKMAYAELNSRSMAEGLLNQYRKISLPAAKSKNAQVGTPTPLAQDYYILARYGGANISESN